MTAADHSQHVDAGSGTLRVAYLGPSGTFTEQALWEFVDDGFLASGRREAVEPQPVTSPAAAMDAVSNNEADFAVVAVENSLDGPVTHTFDALANHPGLHIWAETDVEIAFAIMVRPGTNQADVRRFATHPVARPQVDSWLKNTWPDVEDIAASSNAAAANAVADGDVDAAAAPQRAAEVYGLEIIARNVAEVAGTRTRFILVGPAHTPPSRTGHDRTGVIFTLPNNPGSLVGALSEISMRGVDLARLESRPTRTGLGTYRFHVDMRGHIDDAPIAETLIALKRYCDNVQFLGSWPSEDHGNGQPEAIGQDQAMQWAEASQWLDDLKQGRR